MSKSHRLAWAAGFIDGDGFITVQNRKSKVNGKEYTSSYIRVGACQANKVPLIELQKLFGGNIREKNSGPNREGYNRKQQWVWCLSTQQAKSCLQQLIPFLLHKKEVSLLAIEFQETMQKNKGKLTEDIKTYRAVLKDKITAINSKD